MWIFQQALDMNSTICDSPDLTEILNRRVVWTQNNFGFQRR